jgi:transcriptional regulator with AAA-type ATPase domain
MLIAIDDKMKDVLDIVNRIAGTSATVLIKGEEGVGKKTLARFIHESSARKNDPFVQFDFGGRTSSLVEAEILGYEQGAFTDAKTSRRGVFSAADKGTLLITNIQDISLEMQSLLLRFLQMSEVLPIGASHPHTVDVRVITTAPSDLEQYVQESRFRADLYYRLNVIPIKIPPLRNRPSDIIPLAEMFIDNCSSLNDSYPRYLTEDAKRALMQYTWPGNIRELQNVISKAVLLSKSSDIDSQTLSIPFTSAPQILTTHPSEVQQLAKIQSEFEMFRKTSIIASPIWEGRQFVKENDLCFVLMPFAEERDLQSVYNQHIKPVVSQAGLRCVRADDINDISGVMQSVWEGINRARLIIADLTNRNPNVFYELGIAHTLGKPVIIITQSMDFIPFDLRHLRCIIYEYKPNMIKKFEESLIKTISTALELR